MATPRERIQAAWATGERLELHRAVEQLAAEGYSQQVLEDALESLLLEVRAAGADDDTEEVIMGVWDRLTGWCHESGHIKTQSTPSSPNGSQVGAVRTIQTSATVLPGGKVEIVSPDLPVGRSVCVTITVPGPAAG
ncbi:MAG TPA: hypothetical protein VFG68_23455 [Fimbriiglobus sp.]|nr:hypothetical protein [Fimbriiglobus sp.]